MTEAQRLLSTGNQCLLEHVAAPETNWLDASGPWQSRHGLAQQLTENIGLGNCVWVQDAGYPATFDATCTHLSLMHYYDNCTGARAYFNGQTTLTKRM